MCQAGTVKDTRIQQLAKQPKSILSWNLPSNVKQKANKQVKYIVRWTLIL